MLILDYFFRHYNFIFHNKKTIQNLHYISEMILRSLHTALVFIVITSQNFLIVSGLLIDPCSVLKLIKDVTGDPFPQL